jgi:hypothetical protein
MRLHWPWRTSSESPHTRSAISAEGVAAQQGGLSLACGSLWRPQLNAGKLGGRDAVARADVTRDSSPLARNGWRTDTCPLDRVRGERRGVAR